MNKTLKLMILGIALLFTSSSKTQVQVNVNIGTPPLWGPVGYSSVRYYYLPDVEAYYDVPSAKFIYFSGSAWIHRSYLPVRYRYYDLYSGYKVVMNDYRGNKPYIYYKSHKNKYAKGYRGKPQKTIGMKPGNSKSGGNNKNQPNKGGGKGNYKNQPSKNNYNNHNSGKGNHNKGSNHNTQNGKGNGGGGNGKKK